VSNKKLIETLSHAGTTEADDLLAACNQAVLLIESQADKIEQLQARVDDLEEAIRCVLPYHAHISSFVMNKLHKALKETAE